MKKQKEVKTASGTAKKQKYDEIEVELVMDAYCVGRARALAILREKARQAEESAVAKEDAGKQGRGGRPRTRRAGDPDLMLAEDFFR